MLILRDELLWEEDNHTSIKSAISHGKCFHSGRKFNGNYSDVGFSILLSINKVIWWYITDSNLKDRIGKYKAERTPRIRFK